MTLTELSKELGVPWSTLKLRLKVLKLEKLDLVSEGILRSHFRRGLGEPYKSSKTPQGKLNASAWRKKVLSF